MINVSEEFITAAKENPNYLYRISFTLRSGTSLIVTNEDIISGGFTIDDAVSNSSVLSVGAAIISSVTIALNNREEKFEQYEFKDTVAQVEIGLPVDDTIEYFTRGIYTVVGVEYNNSVIRLTCYDNLYKLEKQYAKSELAYPATINDIVDDICTLCGLTLDSNVSLQFGTMTIEENPTDLTTTCRTVISYIAQLNCMNAVCNEAGELTFKWYSSGLSTENITIRITEDAIRTVENTEVIRITEIPVPIVVWNSEVSIEGFFERNLDRFETLVTGVRIMLPTTPTEDVDGTTGLSEYTSGTDVYMITIENNPFITVSNVDSILTYLTSKLMYFHYRKGTLSHIGLPYITAGDVAEVEDSKGNKCMCLVSSTTFTAGSRQRTESVGASPVEANGAKYSNDTKQYVKYIKDGQNTFTGLYETQIIDQQTQAKTIYLHNKPQLGASDIQIVISAEGIHFTIEGTNNDPPDHPQWYGFNVDGTFIANILNTNGINADWIRTGAFEATSGGNTIFKLDATNKTMEWNLPYSSMDTDGILKLIDSGETGNASVSVEWEANHSLSKMFSTGFICEFDSTTPKFYSTITARGVNAESLWYDDPSDESTYWQYYYDFSVADKLLSVGKIRYENNSVISNDNLFRIDLANDTVRIKGNDVATISTPTFTEASGVTITQQQWSKIGNIVVGNLTFQCDSAIQSTVQVGTISSNARPAFTVIGNARTASTQMRCSINSSGVLNINSETAVAALTTIYVSFSFVV